MPEPSSFRQALAAAMDDETLRLVILLVREHYEHTGSYPTADQIRAKLQRPGA